MKRISINSNIDSDFDLSGDKYNLWQVYLDIFNHLRYESDRKFIFNSNKNVKLTNHFQWIDKNNLSFVCDKHFIKNCKIDKISSYRWDKFDLSSGVEIILEKNAETINR